METINYKYSYPELSETGKEKTQVIINKFKKELEEVMNNTLYSFTCNLGNEIVDDDSWVDIRQKTKEALCGYNDTEGYSGVNWVQVRRKILEENREAIVNDIILDKERDIKNLQDTIEHLQRLRY